MIDLNWGSELCVLDLAWRLLAVTAEILQLLTFEDTYQGTFLL